MGGEGSGGGTLRIEGCPAFNIHSALCQYGPSEELS